MTEVNSSQTATIAAACAPEWNDILRQMILIRRFEEATEREFRFTARSCSWPRATPCAAA
jgi:hypothetical protein